MKEATGVSEETFPEGGGVKKEKGVREKDKNEKRRKKKGKEKGDKE